MRSEIYSPAVQPVNHAKFLTPLELANRFKPHLPYLAIVLLVTAFVGLPLLQPAQMKGHDTFAYLPRMEEFYQQLQHGILFPRWAPDFSAGYGEPFFIFNPPIIYYISAGFHFLGLSFVFSENLTFLFLLVLSGLGMYVLAHEFFGKPGGVVAAVAYVFGPYLLVNIYVRHSLADFSAFAFMPLAWWGLYSYSRKGKFWPLFIGSLAVATLLLSANTIALIAIPALALFLLFLVWAQPTQLYQILTRGVWCLGLGMGLAAFFWVPAFLQRDLVQTGRLISGSFQFQDHFVYLFQLVYSGWGYGKSLVGPGDGMSFALGFVQLVCVAAALWLRRRLAPFSAAGWMAVTFFLVLLGGSAFFSSGESIFLWNRLTLLQYFQFPWRFLSLATISTAFICGFPFLLIKADHPKLANGLMILLVAGLWIQSITHAHPSGYNSTTDADYTPARILADNISINSFEEYQTIWMVQRPTAPAARRVELLSGNGQVTNLESGPTTIQFQVELSQPARIRVNTAYFPGWVLTVDGHPASLSHDNPLGVMEFSLSQGAHTVNLRFGDTPIQQVSAGISILAVGLLLLSSRTWKKPS